MIKVNGEIVEEKEDGSYYIGIKHNESQIQVEATAEDNYAVTTINEVTQNNYIATKTENIEEGKTIYNYTIEVKAENGEKAEYNLTVEQLEGNTNIIKVQVGEDEINLNDAMLKEDGTYYYKINRVTEGYINVELESEKSEVLINGIESLAQKVTLSEERNIIPIKVKAEDGTEKEYKLIIEKKSSSTEIKEITGEGIIETQIEEDIAYVKVDEELESIDLKVVLKYEQAQLKQEGEENYETKEIIRTIDLTEKEENEPIAIRLNIKAEDGTEKEYTISIIKEANLELQDVIVNEETLIYDEEQERYEKQVNNGNKPQITITTSDPKQTIQLLNEQRTILGTGTGTLTTTQTLGATNLTTKYIIKVISNKGEENGANERELWITQKSAETGITYVKVDGLGTSLSTDKTTYTSQVSGKEKYPIEIKLKDVKAEVRVEDLEGNILVDKQTGILKGELEVKDGQTKEYKMVVTSENGNEKEYKLKIERISNIVEIEQITITDYNENETEIITKEVENYYEETKTYKIIVSRNLRETEVTVKANASNIEIDGTEKTSINKNLSGEGTTKIAIKLTAKDGSQEIRYLEIIQQSGETGIQTVEVDGTKIEANQAGNYETTVTNEKDLSEVKVILKSKTSKISINEGQEKTRQSTTNISKGQNRKLIIPLKVTAEDGTTYTYTLTLNILSHDTTVKEVKVNDEQAQISNPQEETKYTAQIGKKETQAKIEITAGVPYSTVSHIKEDETEIAQKEKLIFTMDCSNIDQETYQTTFKITAEDGTEKEYEIEITRKTDDNTIKAVYINDKETEPNQGNQNYEDGTYYAIVEEETAKIKIETNDKKATIEYNGKTGINTLEQTIELNNNGPITEIPVKITSEEGTENQTTIYIERIISEDNSLKEIYVEGILITPNEQGKYEANILDTNENPTVKAITTNKNAYVRIGLGQEEKHSTEQKVTLSNSKQTIIPITVKSQAGQTKITYLYLNKLSTSVALELVTVNEKEQNYYEEATNTYRFVVDNETTEFNLQVIAENEATNLEYEGTNKGNTIEEIITIGREEDGRTIKIKAKSEAGTEKEYTIEIARTSNNANLEYVKVDGKEKQADKTDKESYTVNIKAFATEAEIEIKTEHSYATVKIGDNPIKTGKDKQTISNLEEETTIIPIVVTAVDGKTIKTYNIMLRRTGTKLEGKIITENINNRHKGEISIYLTEDTREIGDENNPRELKRKIETNEDGTFEVLLEEGTICDIVISKKGYLTYMITNIEVEQETIYVGEIYLTAGDVAESGEIEIDDLVDLNDNYGVIITEANREEKEIYDLNGDGRVDMLDRNILKKNYGKIAETVKWVKPEEVVEAQEKTAEKPKTPEEIPTEN